jgi:branched-chain amino acid aminotransferase
VQSKYVWVDGDLVPFDRATTHVLTPALHYGVAVFEGIRCYRTRQGPAIFRLAEHMDRLLDSAAIAGFRDLPYTSAALSAAACETVRANEMQACYIRPIIYLGDGGWNLTIDAGTPRTVIAVWQWDAYLGPAAAEWGVRANVSSFTRLHPNIAMTKAKISGNYANSVLAKTESVRLGFDEAIMLDPHGYVAECTGENIFIVNGGRIYTPPPGAILEGLTRDTIVAVARDAGFSVEERALSRDDLYRADEVLVCGTAAEIIGIREVDFRRIGSGRTGPVTRQLQQLFHDVVVGEHPRSSAWLAYVEGPSARGGDAAIDSEGHEDPGGP